MERMRQTLPAPHKMAGPQMGLVSSANMPSTWCSFSYSAVVRTGTPHSQLAPQIYAQDAVMMGSWRAYQSYQRTSPYGQYGKSQFRKVSINLQTYMVFSFFFVSFYLLHLAKNTHTNKRKSNQKWKYKSMKLKNSKKKQWMNENGKTGRLHNGLSIFGGTWVC
jgi:hypothetical protein